MKQPMWILIIVGGAAAVYFTVIRPSKASVAKYLWKKYGVDYQLAMGMDYGYLHERMKATKQGKDKFVFNGKSYWTINGKAV